jgi:hypothetical protein
VTPELRELANHLVTASAALSGLVLVFLGAILNSYDQFDASEQASVRPAYRLRAWMGLWGFGLSLAGGAMAVAASVCTEVVWLVLAGLSLALSLVLLLIMAVMAVWDI